jgi:hypothetical protein
MIAWFLSPYKLQKQLNRQVRYCQIFDLWNEIAESGGYAHELEIADNQALVKVRASNKVLRDLSKIPGNQIISDPSKVWSPTRIPVSIVDGEQIISNRRRIQNTPIGLIDQHVFNDDQQELFKRLAGKSMEYAEKLGYYRLPYFMPNDLKYAILGEVAPQGYDLGRISPGTFPTQSVFDDANRADEGPPPSASWINVSGGSGLKISNNRWVADSTGGFWVTKSSVNFGPDCECFYDIVTIDRSQSGAIQIYMRDTNTTPGDNYLLGWYTATSPADVLTFTRNDDDVGTNLGSYIYLNCAAGYSFGFEIIGTTLAGYYRTTTSGPFSLISTRVDATYSAAGRIVIAMAGGAGHQYDNIGRGAVIVAGGPIQPTAIASSQAFGTTSVLDPGSVLQPTGLANGQLLIAWNTNTEPDLAGYRIYYGYSAGIYSGVVDVGFTETPGNPSYLLSSLKLQTTYIALTAYDNSNNESLFSSEFSATPSGQVIKGIVVTNSVEQISPTSVAPSESFGQVTVVQPDGIVTLSSISSAEFINTALLNFIAVVSNTGIVSTEAFGTYNIGDLQVKLTSIPETYEVSQIIIIAGNVDVPTSSITSLESLNSPELIKYSSIINTGIASTQAFGAITIFREFRVLPYEIISHEGFGNLNTIRTRVLVFTGLSSSESVSSITLKKELFFVVPSTITTGNIVGTPSLGSYFGTLLNINPVNSTEAFGSSSLLPGVVNISPSGVISGVNFGNNRLFLQSFITSNAIASSEGLGNLLVLPGNRNVNPYGMFSLENFGITKINKVIVLSSISSLEAFGNINLARLINLSGIPTQEATTSPILSSGPVVILVSSFFQGSTPGENALVTFTEEPGTPTMTIVADPLIYNIRST